MSYTIFGSIQSTAGETLPQRLKNIANTSISETEMILSVRPDDTINSYAISNVGKSLLNLSDIASLKAQILETTEEAVLFTSDATNSIKFYTNTGGTPSLSSLRVDIQDTYTQIYNILRTKNIEVDNANKIVCNNIAYRDDNTNPVFINFDADHTHFLSPDGIRINQQFQIDSANGANPTHLLTTAANKSIQISCHGTGKIQTLSTLETQADILPNITLQRDIGSSSLKYNNVFTEILNTGNIKASTLFINDGSQNAFRLTTASSKSYIQSQYKEIVFSAYISSDAVLSIFSKDTDKRVITHHPLETDFIRPIATQSRDIGTTDLQYRDIYTQNTRNSGSLYTNTLRPNSGSYIDITGADLRVDTGHQLQTSTITTGTGDLTVNPAGSNVIVNSGKQLQVNNTITTGSGDLNLNPTGTYVAIPSGKILTATTISSPALDLTLSAGGSNVKILQGKTFRVSDISTETGDISISPIGNNVIIGGSKNLQTSSITTGSGDLNLTPTGSNVIVNSGKNLQTSTITSTSDLTINPTGSNVIVNSGKNLQVSNITTASGNLILNPGGTHIEINSSKILKTNEITTHSTQDLKLSPNSNKVVLEGLTSLVAEPITVGAFTYVPEIGSDDKLFGQSYITTQNCKRTKLKHDFATSSSAESCIQQLSDVLQIGYNNETALGSVQVINSSLGTSRIDLKENKIELLVADTGSVNTAPVSRLNLTSSGIICGDVSGADAYFTVVNYQSLSGPSDIRLKQDILNLDVGLNEICQLNPIKFRYKTDLEREHYGFIAQEVEKVFPKNLVSTHKKTGMLNLNMMNLIAPMVSSIQTLKQEVEELKQTNKQLLLLLNKLV